MRLRNKLLALFDIQPAEGRLVLLLLALYFCIGAARIFTRTTAYALFLVDFDAQALPYIYVGISVIVTLASFIYLKLGERLAFSKLLIANLSFLLLALSAFRLGLGLTEARSLTFALPIWHEVLSTLTSLAFWGLAGRLFNVRQGKRLFGLIGAGEWVANVAAGFLMPLLVALIGTPNLLLVAAAGIAGALLLLVTVTRSFAGQLAATTDSVPAARKEQAGGLLQNRYVVMIFVLFFQCVMAYFFVDNIFYHQARTKFPDEEQLAGFIGVFFAVVGMLTLFSTTVLTGPLISRYGLRFGVLALPVTLAAGTASIVLVGTVIGIPVVLFWLVSLTKLLNVAILLSIDRSALSTLYQPLPPDHRVRAQTVTEGIVYPLGIGSAGGLLLLLTHVFALNVLQLATVLLVILAGWITVAILLGRKYPVMLMQALAKRRLGGAALSLADGSSRAVLQKGLQSPYAEVVIYSLHMLETTKYEALATTLQDLLAHPAPEVRQYVLEQIERLGLIMALPSVSQRVSLEPSPLVRGAALRTLAALGEAKAFEEVSAYLEDPEPRVRLGAMVGLLRSSGIEGVLVAGQRLLHMAGAQDPADRAMAAQVLGEVGVSSFYQPLVPLLRDKDPQVQRAALQAAGRLRNPKLWPLVIEGLGSPQVHRAAAAALVAGGESVLPELEAAFAQVGQEGAILIRLAQICGRIRGVGATALLLDKIEFPDEETRSQILRALSRCGYQARGEEVARVQRQIKAEVGSATLTLAAMVDIGDDEGVALLQGALGAKLAQHRARLFDLLSFIYDVQSVRRVQDNLDHGSDDKRAYALEVIDVLVSQELKGMLFPVLDDLPPGQRLQRLSALFPQPQLGCQQRLQEIITEPEQRFNAWTKACALYAVGRLAVVELSDTVAAALSAPDPLLRETAAWSLFKLNVMGNESLISQLSHGPSPPVVGATRRLETARKGDDRMLLTIEKVIILKTVGIFAETPDDILAEVASLMEEVEVSAGETVFEKGSVGNSMYVIVDGEMRAHLGEATLNYLGEREVFGEMALLDAEPRVASISATQDTLLLRLDQQPFYELMEDRGEIARGIVRILLQRLRARVQDLNDLRSRIEEKERSGSGPTSETVRA